MIARHSEARTRGRRERRREEAEARQEARSARSIKQQIKLLDERLGEGSGARKERKRLAAMLEEN